MNAPAPSRVAFVLAAIGVAVAALLALLAIRLGGDDDGTLSLYRKQLRSAELTIEIDGLVALAEPGLVRSVAADGPRAIAEWSRLDAAAGARTLRLLDELAEDGPDGAALAALRESCLALRNGVTAVMQRTQAGDAEGALQAERSQVRASAESARTQLQAVVHRPGEGGGVQSWQRALTQSSTLFAATVILAVLLAGVAFVMLRGGGLAPAPDPMPDPGSKLPQRR